MSKYVFYQITDSDGRRINRGTLLTGETVQEAALHFLVEHKDDGKVTLDILGIAECSRLIPVILENPMEKHEMYFAA